MFHRHNSAPDVRPLSSHDRVAQHRYGREIADVLAHTDLADPYGPADIEAHWSDAAVLEATERILDRLRAAGLPVDVDGWE